MKPLCFALALLSLCACASHVSLRPSPSDTTPRPEYLHWPAGGREPYAWPIGDGAHELLAARFDAASKSPLAAAGEEAKIRSIPLPGDARIHELRWLFPSLAVAHASWYRGPEAAASYFVVYERVDTEWRVKRCYLLAIS